MSYLRSVWASGRQAIRDPLLRNGYALLANTVCTALLGVCYWVVAAQLFDPVQIGRAAAAITTMSLLASLGGLNLSGALAFLLPQLGSSAKAYVLRSYVATTAFSLVLVLPLGLLSLFEVAVPGLPDLRRLDLLLLVVAVPLWTVFTLQDGVLTGLRHATWVLVENSAFGVTKLLLLPVAAILGWSSGVFLTWVIPLVAAVLVVNIVMFLRVLPAVRERPQRLAFERRQVLQFLGHNYLGSLLYQAYFNLLPVLVLLQLGARANGLFYVAWTLASSLDLLSRSLAAALTVEGSTNPELLPALTRQVVMRLYALLTPIVLFTLAAAPMILLVYGKQYADGSSDVLRLLVVGALPRTLLIVAQSVARAQGNARTLVLTEAVTCALVLTISTTLLPELGATAVGVAWIVGNVAVLPLVLGPLLKVLRNKASSRSPVGSS